MEARTEQAPGRIFTFFSFKGGVGRTLALANVGFLLASYGRSVLLVDADLEAPGLTLFLLPKRRSAQPGFVDFFLKVREVFLRRAQSPTQPKGPPDLDPKHYLVPLDLPRELLTSPVGKPGRVSLMPAGRLDENYVSRLADVRIGETYQAGYGAPLAWEIRRHLQEAGFDYVLIDSRTGYSDISGALLIDVSDRTVVISGLNRQNVEGTRRYLEEIGFLPAPEPPKPRRFLLVASPLPREEPHLGKERLEIFAKTLGSAPDVELIYHPRLALIEEIFAADFPKDATSIGYRTLAALILDTAHDGIEAHLRAASDALRDRDLSALAREVELVARQSPEQAIAYLRGASDFLTHVLSGDRKSAEEIIRKLEVSADRKEWLDPFLTDSMLAPKLRALIESIREPKKDVAPRRPRRNRK